MKKRYKITRIITLLLFIVKITCVEEKKDIVAQLEETALKKYPWLVNENMGETMMPTSGIRRHGSVAWHQDWENRPLHHRYWYRNTQTFAFDLQYYVKTGGDRIKLRGCHMITKTYLGASSDIRRYYTMRYLYHDNIDYEIGYMAHEIISKYQNLIELFGIARKKYFYNRLKHNAPTRYLFNKYMHMLETSNAIIHLCNLFHEIRFKFGEGELPSATVFKDSLIEEKIKGPVPGRYTVADVPVVLQIINVTGGETVESLQAKEEKERKKKRRTIRLTDRWTPMHTLIPPYPSPYKSWRWPLIYGWSIENW